jgi:hypothetical protein
VTVGLIDRHEQALEICALAKGAKIGGIKTGGRWDPGPDPGIGAGVGAGAGAGARLTTAVIKVVTTFVTVVVL